MDGWSLARAVAALLPRALATFAAGAVSAWMVATGDYRLIVDAMGRGVEAVSDWTGLYDSLTRMVTP